MGRSVTIEDVAREAGVSVATVSRALRGLPNVAPATRQRVEQVAQQLQYRPDPSAARLATGRTTTVAAIVPHLDSWYLSKVMSGAEAVLAEAGYDLLIFVVDSRESRRRVLSGPLAKRADGLIIVDVHLPPDESAALDRSLGGTGVRIVSVGFGRPETSRVVVDDQLAAATAVQHLADLGHTRIALIGGPSDLRLSFGVPRRRRRGYLQTIEKLGLEVRPDYDAAGEFSVAGGVEAAGVLLDLEVRPTAVFAMSDEMAFGAIEAARIRGLSVPGDLSVVGVGDHEVSRVMGLTTIQQDAAAHGTLAAQLLLRHLENPELRPEVIQARSELVIRRSTARPET